MNEWKQAEKEQCYRGSLALTIGSWCVYYGGEATISLWMNNVPEVPFWVYSKALLCFLGLIVVMFACMILIPIIKVKMRKVKPIVEAIAWEHFKMVEPLLAENTPQISEKVVIERPKAQTLTRVNKDLVKTNQVTAVLNEEDVERIKNISLNFLTKSQK